MYVKLCGITDVAQVPALVACGPDALGINLIPSSKRYVSLELARSLISAIRTENRAQGKHVECVAVVSAEQLPPEFSTEGFGGRVESLLDDPSFDRIQLHAADPTATWQALRNSSGSASAKIFLAAQIAGPEDAERASGFPGAPLLVDAKVGNSLGGTGHSFDWSLVEALATSRDLLLAGGLDAEKLPRAIAQVHPWGVDVASGIESGTPGIKDLKKCEAFVAAARAASIAVEKSE
ncbi:MAG: phosphoribosylanthranilate isomerase [Polyangiaceae bacterium]|nr:phosphoribosylanthranilate isomerase [Polyangiaceae bacterium]MCB9605403.1 phosphoribosylanthranilate isomerase [Polyangiaceae bacterium]